MNLWTRFKTLLTGHRKPKFLLDNPGKIVEAFQYLGETYYCYESMFSIPTVRGLQAIDFYEEFNMRCTREFLLKFSQAIDEVLSPPQGKKIDLHKLYTLAKYLRERLEGLPSQMHIMRLASVVFFTADEDPLYWSREQADRKIEKWKRNPEILAFFLRMPLDNLINSSQYQLISSSTSMAVQAKIDQLHLKEVCTILSVKDIQIDM